MIQWSWFWNNLLAIWFGVMMVAAALGVYLAGRASQWLRAMTHSFGLFAGILYFTVGIFPALAHWQYGAMAIGCTSFLVALPGHLFRAAYLRKVLRAAGTEEFVTGVSPAP